MSDPTIVLLPPLPPQSWSWQEVAAELAAYHHRFALIPPMPAGTTNGDLDLAGAWVAHCALQITRAAALPPLLLVAQGGSGQMLAALGFAQRASRRRVVGYVLVDGDLPKPGVQDWPDAPVTYMGSSQAHLALLRGWEVLPGEDVGTELRRVASLSV